MKRNLTHWITLFVAILGFSPLIHAQPQTYVLDKNHTYVLWSINHLGFSTQVGKMYATGQLVLDKDHPDQSSVRASINTADDVTGLPELDEHLKSKLFFDTTKFPSASFASNKVTVVDQKNATVDGMLTLHGVTKPVTLHVTFNQEGVNPITYKPSVGFTATTSIKRSDFGMNSLLPSLGDKVDIEIGAEAFQDKK